MKICLVNPDLIKDGGGLEWSIQRITNFLADEGHSIHIVGLSANRDAKFRKKKKSTITEYPTWRPDVRFFDISPYFSQPATDYAWHEIFTGLKRLSSTYGYEIFHAFNISYTGYITTMIAHQLEKPIILSGRGSDLNRNIFAPGVFSRTKWVLEKADVLTFVSSAMQANANQITSCLHKSMVILNSTDMKYFDTSRKVSSYLKDDQTFIIGGAGILGRKKGITIFSKAIHTLIEYQHPIKMLWIGEVESGKEDRKFFQEFESLRNSGVIQMTGVVPHQEVLNFLEILDLYVLASIDEGCPNALLEAMLASRPIVATEVGAIPEIVRNGREGVLIPPYDVPELVNAIIKMKEDSAMREQLGQAAFDRVTTFCTAQKERKLWLECYDKATQASDV